MADQIQGYRSLDDVRAEGYSVDMVDGEHFPTVENSAEMLDIPTTSTEDEIDSRYRDLVPDAHPDLRGNPDLFTALTFARDQLLAYEQSKGGGAPEDEFEQAERTPGSRGGFASAARGDVSEEEIRQLKQAVRELLDRHNLYEDLKGEFGQEEVVNVITSLILQGSLDLGDLERTVSSSGPFGGTRNRGFSRRRSRRSGASSRRNPYDR